MLISDQESAVYTYRKTLEGMEHVDESMIDTAYYPSPAVLECLMRFLNMPTLKNLGLKQKCDFLRQKGLTEKGK
jgi:hypothetical protein